MLPGGRHRLTPDPRPQTRTRQTRPRNERQPRNGRPPNPNRPPNRRNGIAEITGALGATPLSTTSNCMPSGGCKLLETLLAHDSPWRDVPWEPYCDHTPPRSAHVVHSRRCGGAAVGTWSASCRSSCPSVDESCRAYRHHMGAARRWVVGIGVPTVIRLDCS